MPNSDLLPSLLFKFNQNQLAFEEAAIMVLTNWIEQRGSGDVDMSTMVGNRPCKVYSPSVGRQILNTTSPLTAREVYQVLKDVALGIRIMTRTSSQSLSEIYNGLMPVEIDGWRLTLFNDGGTLDYCEDCRSPDGHIGSLETWQRYGTDPVELLSGWEREQLERLLNAL
jgi:hypothetical protein